MPVSIELPGPVRKQAVASLQQYADSSLDQPLGDLAAGSLLDFFLEEIAPAVYNQAVADAQDRLQHRVGELHGEVYAEPFQYWPRLNKRRQARRT